MAKKTVKKKINAINAKKTAVNNKEAPAKTGEKKQQITKDMLIGDIAMKYPKAVPIMFKYGMHCIGCGMTAYETLEQGSMAHGISGKEIDKMVEEMNKLISK